MSEYTEEELARAKMPAHMAYGSQPRTLCRGRLEEGHVRELGPDELHRFRCEYCGWQTDDRPTIRRLNTAPIQYDREEMLELLQNTWLYESLTSHEKFLDEYEKQRREGKDKPCQAKVWHGPGHQSSTFCEVTGGEYEHYKNSAGKTVHEASLPSGGYAEWTDDDPFDRSA